MIHGIIQENSGRKPFEFGDECYNTRRWSNFIILQKYDKT